MDNNRLEELYNRALDGCLSPEDEREFASHLKDHPGVLSELEDLDRIRRDLQAHIPAEVEPPYPDFFNAHLERLIREDEAALAPSRAAKPSRSMWLNWLLPAAAAAVLAFFAGMQLGGPGEAAGGVVAAAVPVVYSPITSVRPEAMLDLEIGGTVIILEGLEAIPDSVDLAQSAWERDGSLRLVSAEETRY